MKGILKVTHLDENNPNVILHQNVKWKIPGSVVVPISSDKEKKNK